MSVLICLSVNHHFSVNMKVLSIRWLRELGLFFFSFMAGCVNGCVWVCGT